MHISLLELVPMNVKLVLHSGKVELEEGNVHSIEVVGSTSVS